MAPILAIAGTAPLSGKESAGRCPNNFEAGGVVSGAEGGDASLGVAAGGIATLGEEKAACGSGG
jgi:hypothetical protein